MRATLAVLWVWLASLAPPVQAQEPIRIGAFLAMTGPAAFAGEPQAKTLRLYVDRINKAGGIEGRPIELIGLDTASDPRQAVSLAKRLIENDQVVLLIGGSTTGETMAAVPVVEEQRVPYISLAGANVIVEPVKKFVFKVPHSDRIAVEKIYADMKKARRSRVAIIAGTSGFDQSCRKEARALAAKHGVTIVADESYGPSDIDLSAQFNRIKEAAGIQAILGCGFGVQTKIAARHYRKLGLENVAFYFNHSVGSQQFIDDAGGAAEGLRVPVAAVLVADQLALEHPQRAVAEAFGRAYRAAYEEPASVFGGHAHDALMIAAAAIKRAGASDRVRLRDEIEATKGFVGAAGLYTMSPRDHMGLTANSLRIAEIRDNSWKLAD